MLIFEPVKKEEGSKKWVCGISGLSNPCGKPSKQCFEKLRLLIIISLILRYKYFPYGNDTSVPKNLSYITLLLHFYYFSFHFCERKYIHIYIFALIKWNKEICWAQTQCVIEGSGQRSGRHWYFVWCKRLHWAELIKTLPQCLLGAAQSEALAVQL